MKRLNRVAILAALAIATLKSPAGAQGLPTFCNGVLTASSVYTRQASDTVLEYHAVFQNQDSGRRRISAMGSLGIGVTVPGFLARFPLTTFNIEFGQPKDLVFLTLQSSSVGFGVGSPPVAPTPSAALGLFTLRQCSLVGVDRPVNPR
jgi:hypothetical protein